MFTGLEAEMKKIREHVKKLEAEAVQETKLAANHMMEQLFMRTPVWEGTTVRNFYVTAGTASSGGGRKSAIGTDQTGATNKMELGEEPRRAANEGAARAEMSTVIASMQRLVTVEFDNASPHWDLIDNGGAPGGPGQNIRNPGGVSILAAQSTKAARGGRWK